jgi:hypothetical protein
MHKVPNWHKSNERRQSGSTWACGVVRAAGHEDLAGGGGVGAVGCGNLGRGGGIRGGVEVELQRGHRHVACVGI